MDKDEMIMDVIVFTEFRYFLTATDDMKSFSKQKPPAAASQTMNKQHQKLFNEIAATGNQE